MRFLECRRGKIPAVRLRRQQFGVKRSMPVALVTIDTGLVAEYGLATLKSAQKGWYSDHLRFRHEDLSLDWFGGTAGIETGRRIAAE